MAALVYDGVILLGVLMLASAVALPFGGAGKIAFRDFWFTLWLFGSCFAYLGGLWRYGGLTVGMRAWKIRLISADNRPMTWPRCLLRFLVALVSLGTAGMGFLWALVDERNRAWHDLATGTLLIKTGNTES